MDGSARMGSHNGRIGDMHVFTVGRGEHRPSAAVVVVAGAVASVPAFAAGRAIGVAADVGIVQVAGEVVLSACACACACSCVGRGPRGRVRRWELVLR